MKEQVSVLNNYYILLPHGNGLLIFHFFSQIVIPYVLLTFVDLVFALPRCYAEYVGMMHNNSEEGRHQSGSLKSSCKSVVTEWVFLLLLESIFWIFSTNHFLLSRILYLSNRSLGLKLFLVTKLG